MIRCRVLPIGLVLIGAVLVTVGASPAGAAPSSPQAAPSSPRPTPSQPQVAIDPQRGLPGTAVRVTPQLTAPSTCTVGWDNDPAVSFFCGPNRTGQLGSTTLTVPALASPGRHSITVCSPLCASVDPVWFESDPFLVLAVVPDLADRTIDQARGDLKLAGLTLGKVTGSTADPAALVDLQTPAANSVVDPGAAVDVRVAGPASSTTPGGVTSPATPNSVPPVVSPTPVVFTASTAPSWRPQLILAMLLGAGLLLVWIAVDASVRRRRRRRRRRQSRLRVTVSQHARLVDISNTGRSATHTVAIACRRNSTVTAGKALR